MLRDKTIWNKSICVLYAVQISKHKLQYNVNTCTVKMEHPVTTYTIVDLRVVVLFLCARGEWVPDIVCLLCDMYAPTSYLMIQQCRGVEKFLTGRTSLQDEADRGRACNS